ncbi:S-layer homology domain-containing protein [bacterium]|nr:S-layer homology domain-containing protein [bacterium]
MKKLFKYTLICLVCVHLTYGLCAQEELSLGIDNPQVKMIGARHSALGGTNPVIFGDINGLFINPSVISHIESMPFSSTYQRMMSDFEYYTINSSYPFKLPIPKGDEIEYQNASLGLSVGRVAMENIPETVFENERVRPIGMYSSGFNIVQLSVASSWYDVFNFTQLSGGFGTKLFNQFLNEKNRTAMGFDAGFTAIYQTNHPWVNNLYVGGSILNLFATSLKWDGVSGESLLPFQMFFGGGADLFDDFLTVYANNSAGGLSFSGEVRVTDIFSVRGSSDFSKFSFGTGIVFSELTGVGYEDYSVRFDYAYTSNDAPLDNIPNHIFSISILGETMPKQPKILDPRDVEVVNTPYYHVKGRGPKYTSMQIFNNDNLKRTARSSRFGSWGYEGFPLNEGKNTISVKAYDIDSDFSLKSDSVVIISDTLKPTVNITSYVENDYLKFIVTSLENLGEVNARIDNKSLVFQHDDGNKKVWVAEAEAPARMVDNSYVSKEMSMLKLYAKDVAGNSMDILKIPFFVGIEFPKDKYVQYKDKVRVIGKSSILAKSVAINGKSVYVDDEQNFSLSVPLDPGKNLLEVVVESKNDQLLTYIMRILSLTSFPDIQTGIKQRREIEFMATLGVIFGDKDGTFQPNKNVTRRYITKMMVNASKTPLDPIEGDVFADVPSDDPDAAYIQTAVMNGLVFAFPDGTFKPDRPLTLSETVALLSNAYIIGDQEVEDTGEFLKRKELAMFLAYTPKYEPKVERLINWESGYLPSK